MQPSFTYFRVLTSQDFDAILALEKSSLQKKFDDPMQAEISSWSARWRQECLNHYLALGWSAGLFEKETEKLIGYFLAQPLLFFRGQTQTLWLEHLSGSSDATTQQVDEQLIPSAQRQELFEICLRYAKDKHFQRVLTDVSDFPQTSIFPHRQLGSFVEFLISRSTS